VPNYTVLEKKSIESDIFVESARKGRKRQKRLDKGKEIVYDVVVSAHGSTHGTPHNY
jgi:cold shock CspA family protein